MYNTSCTACTSSCNVGTPAIDAALAIEQDFDNRDFFDFDSPDFFEFEDSGEINLDEQQFFATSNDETVTEETTEETVKDEQGNVVFDSIGAGFNFLKDTVKTGVELLGDEKIVGNVTALITALKSEKNLSKEESAELLELKNKLQTAQSQAENAGLRAALQAQQAQLQLILQQQKPQQADHGVFSSRNVLIAVGLGVVLVLALRK